MALASTAITGCNHDDGEGIGPFEAAVPESLPLTTGLHKIQAGGVAREFYVALPADYEQLGNDKPVIIGFHGTGGTYEAWLNGTYDLEQAVDDGAILVYPQALADPTGTNQWDYDYDLEFFEKLLIRLQRGLRYDGNKIFVTGHSSGGGFAHELACQYGDVIRGAAPVAGGLLSNACIGSVAVIQIHGENDALVPVGVADIGRQTWVAYNGFDIALSAPTQQAPCVDYSLGVGSYPVHWCLHQEGSLTDFSGHAWPSFASAAIWQFFAALPTEARTDAPPPNGGNDKIQALFDTTISFTLRYPQNIATIVATAVAAYPEGTVQAGTAPAAILSTTGFDPGNVSAGAEIDYLVPVKFGGLQLPGTYSIQFAIYVEGGGFPIPVAGIDHVAIRDIFIPDASTPIIIDEPIDVAPVQ